jgi:hypothetical protein
MKIADADDLAHEYFSKYVALAVFFSDRAWYALY